MIKLMMNSILIYSVWVNNNSNNPMKTSFSILLATAAMFLYLKMKLSMVWMPLIFFILFTGGILMMFMILSSVLPNEKTMKIKYSKIWSLMTFMLLISSAKSTQMNTLPTQTKSFITSGLNLILMMLIILVYFFNSINLNSMEDSPMRSLQC